MLYIGIYIASVFIALLFLNYLAGAQKPARCAFGNAALGIGSLLAVELTGVFTGVSLHLSLLNLGAALAGGPSGVALLLAFNAWIV